MVAWGRHCTMVSGKGLNTIVAINGQGTNLIDALAGTSVVWAGMTDTVWGGNYLVRVGGFANGAGTTPNSAGANPTDGQNYIDFSSNPLFASAGPTRDDIFQGGVDDCWMMAPLSAIADKDPLKIRSMVVDFHDGTYGVLLGGKLYRVDGKLPTDELGYLSDAGLGQQGSLWVPIVEKAYANYRHGDNTYSSLDQGRPGDAFETFNCPDEDGWTSWGIHSGTDAFRQLFQEFQAGLASVVCMTFPVASGSHCYYVTGFDFDLFGNPRAVHVRNPYGLYETYSEAYFIAQWREIRYAHA
jgi:hypothetical protein